MSGVIFSGIYAYGIILNDPIAQNPATIAASGDVANSGTAAVYGAPGPAWSVTNYGTMVSEEPWPRPEGLDGPVLFAKAKISGAAAQPQGVCSARQLLGPVVDELDATAPEGARGQGGAEPAPAKAGDGILLTEAQIAALEKGQGRQGGARQVRQRVPGLLRSPGHLLCRHPKGDRADPSPLKSRSGHAG